MNISMRPFLLSSILCLVAVLALPHNAGAESAPLTIRTGMVEAINSIKLLDTSSEVFRNIGPLPIALYEMEFSISAFEEDVEIPTAVTRGTTDTRDIEFLIESRTGDTTTSGLAGGFLSSDAAQSNGAYRIKKGTTETFTLFVAFTDTPDPSREDRVRVSGMTLRAGDAVAELNAQELKRIRSSFADLVLSK